MVLPDPDNPLMVILDEKDSMKMELRCESAAEATHWIEEMQALQKADQEKNADALNSMSGDQEKVNPMVLSGLRSDFMAACKSYDMPHSNDDAAVFVDDIPMQAVGVVKGLLKAVAISADFLSLDDVKACHNVFTAVQRQLQRCFAIIVDIKKGFNAPLAFFLSFRKPIEYLTTWIENAIEFAKTRYSR